MFFEGLFSLVLLFGYFNVIGEYLLPGFNVFILVLYAIKYSNRIKSLVCSIRIFDSFLIVLIFAIALINFTSLFDLTKLAAYFLFFYICLIATDLNKVRAWESAAIIFALISIVASIPLYFLNEDFVFRYNRFTSIFLDPNYYGLFLGYAVLCIVNRNFRYKYVFLIMVLGALVLTYSKTAFLSLFVAICLLIRFRYVLLALCGFAILAAVYEADSTTFSYLDGFRFDTGLNKRDIFWEESILRIANSPFEAFGHSSVLDLLADSGYKELSLHNTYLEFAFNYSAVSLLVYCLFLFVYLKRSGVTKYNGQYLVYFGTASLFMSITIGGVGYFPVLFATYFTIYYFYEKT